MDIPGGDSRVQGMFFSSIIKGRCDSVWRKNTSPYSPLPKNVLRGGGTSQIPRFKGI